MLISATPVKIKESQLSDEFYINPAYITNATRIKETGVLFVYLQDGSEWFISREMANRLMDNNPTDDITRYSNALRAS